MEKSAEAFYRAGAGAFDELRSTFEHLASDEARHATTYQAMLSRGGTTLTSEEKEAAYRRVRGLLSLGLFSKLEAWARLVKEAKDRRQILEAAAGLEKDTLLLYYSMLDALEPDERNVVYRVIDSEQSHLAEVTSLLK